MTAPLVDLSIHHQPKGLSDQVAFGFTKLLRFCADTFFAKRYWGLPDDATLRDVVLVVRADEAHHRDVNHGYANELGGLPIQAVAPCPPHAALEPTWKAAA